MSEIPSDILQAYATNATGIPPDITPEYLAQSRDGPAYAGIIFVGVLTLIVLTLRCYARAVIIKSFGIDDALAVVTMITFLAFIGLCIWLIELGSGRHIEYIEYVLDGDTTNRTEVVDFAAHIIYTTSLFICRLSGLFFYRRLCQGSKRLMLLTQCAGVFLVAGYLPQVFLIIFHCLPVTGYWPYAWQVPEVNNYTCLEWGVVYVVNSSVSLLCDLLMLTIPALLILTLKVDLRSKINLSLILFPGVIVIGVSCARLYLVVQGQWQPDQAWWYDPQLVIECTEIGGTLIALSVPALKPLVVQWSAEISTYARSRRTAFSASADTTVGGRNRHSLGSGITGKAKAVLLGSHQSEPDVERSISQDPLTEKDAVVDENGIQKTVSIQMDVWDAR